MIGIESALTGIVTRDCTAKVSARGKPYTQINLKIGDGKFKADWPKGTKIEKPRE